MAALSDRKSYFLMATETITPNYYHNRDKFDESKALLII